MRFFVAIVLSLALASTALGAVYRLKGNFVERRSSLENGHLTGTFYYLYDTSNSSKCRLRFEYSLPNGMVVSDLYDFELNAMYSMCPGSCTAETTRNTPDPFWYDSTKYEKMSDTAVDGKFWYKRKATGVVNNRTLHVYKILMTSDTTPKDNGVAQIEFYDGRVIEISSVSVNPNDLPQNSAKFKTDPGLNCPIPTCSIYTDIVFVLDSSGSVDTGEWRQQADFVISVMNSFTFGDNAAAAAVIQFNAPACGQQPDWKYFSSCYKQQGWDVLDDGDRAKGDWDYSRTCGDGENRVWNKRKPGCCKSDENTTDRTASVLAGAGTHGNMTLSTNKDDLVATMEVNRTPVGGTCQAFGLELAMKVFDRSPRKNYASQPHRIVIAVTDGADYCPNLTRTLAGRLRDEYDALFLGIGVGLSCNYDKNFIKDLTSTVGGQKAYYDVSNYNAIKQVAEQIFSPLCDELHTSCGPDCHGFCGCGDCFCPDCESSGDMCNDYRCTAGGGASDGCQMTEVDNCDEDDLCNQHTCDPATGTCNNTWTCTEVAESNPGTCRSVKCDVNDGSCKVELNHEMCINRFGSKCVEWECAPEGVTVVDDPETGCRIKSDKNINCTYTQGCWNYIGCDEDTGNCVREDTCVSNECEKFACSEEGTCVGTPVPRPPTFVDTPCTKYACDNLTGWYVSVSKNSQWCYDAATDKSCKTFYCDVNVVPDGCTFDVLDECDDKCTEEVVANCLEEGHQESSVDECKLFLCRVRKVGSDEYGSDSASGDTEAYCKLNKTINCFESPAADDARQRNEANPNVCYNVECDHGDCGVTNTVKPEGDTACQKYVCVYNANTHYWSWELHDTVEKTSCSSDECYYRYCDDALGCVKTDICRNRTTECATFSCENKKCTYKNTTLKETECTEEYCTPEGKILVKQKPLEKACPNANKCEEAVCTELGTCMYKNTTHNNDPCMITVCDPSKGWVSTPKCNDGRFCTVDKCTVKGECRYTDVNCYLEIDMSEHPCFRAVCKEDNAHNNYTCTKKKKDGVYIDVCGNCLRLEDTGSSSDSLGDPTTDCVDAPDEYVPKNELAAATIAMIILGAIIIGAAIGTTTVIGTKTLLEHARAANNQSAHSNPLFEGEETEMNNPAFAGEEN